MGSDETPSTCNQNSHLDSNISLYEGYAKSLSEIKVLFLILVYFAIEIGFIPDSCSGRNGISLKQEIVDFFKVR
jgi:hypothetical protein